MFTSEVDFTKDPEIRKILATSMANTKYYAKTFFPGTFYSPFSNLHNQIFDAIDSGHKKIAIAAPRGLGKTSIARTVAQKAIMFRMANFIVYLMNSATVAEMQTENIKRELLTNRMVRGIFGNIKESDFEYEMDEQFSKLSWVAYGNTLVLPRGAGQQVRGLNWNNHRPEIVIVDDLENKELIKTKENRDAIKQWFYSDVLKSFNFYKKNWFVIYIDTIKHEDSLLQELMDSPDWYSIRLSICDENYKSLDPNYMTDSEIEHEVAEHRRLGTLDLFYMERMNIPVAKENASFAIEYFKEHDEVELWKDRNLENVVIVDPAKTTNLKSADSAIVGIGVDVKKGMLRFRDCVSEKLHPDELYDAAFAMAARLRTKTIGVEVTSLEEFIKQPFINEAKKRGLVIEFIWLKARGGQNDEKGKVERIKGLIPYYRQGRVTHNKAVSGKLEQQLLSFPKSKLWDVMDAFAYIVEMMELGGRYFESPEENYDNPSEDEYDDIDNAPELDEWRTI
jgi:hypothetical protein